MPSEDVRLRDVEKKLERLESGVLYNRELMTEAKAAISEVAGTVRTLSATFDQKIEAMRLTAVAFSGIVEKKIDHLRMTLAFWNGVVAFVVMSSGIIVAVWKG
jgi:hypothetical protein